MLLSTGPETCLAAALGAAVPASVLDAARRHDRLVCEVRRDIVRLWPAVAEDPELALSPQKLSEAIPPSALASARKRMEACTDAAVEVARSVRGPQAGPGYESWVLPEDAFFARGAALRGLSLNTEENPSIDIVRTRALPLLPVVRMVSVALLTIAESLCHHRTPDKHEDAVALKHAAAATFTRAADLARDAVTGPERARDRGALHCDSWEGEKTRRDASRNGVSYRVCALSESAYGCPTTLRALASEQMAEAQAMAREHLYVVDAAADPHPLEMAGLSKAERDFWTESSELRVAAGAYEGAFDDAEADRLADEALVAAHRAEDAERRCLAGAAAAIGASDRLRANALMRCAGQQACRDARISAEEIAAARCSAGIQDIVGEDRIQRVMDSITSVNAMRA